ncbi:pyridoxamine 5'-phosphate oxidase-domain-containing protein [Nemania sp. FL0916]|nr:pyridoxamine 5'-phosphate oxidase-domain-containing protein [Nemania sp. FL0916]
MKLPLSTAVTSRLAQLTTHLRPPHHTLFSTTTTTTTSTITTTSETKMSAKGQAAPWRSQFLSHLEGMASPEFTLATVRRAPATQAYTHPHTYRRSSLLAAPVYLPRARTCICRGFWASLPENPKNDAPRNPAGVWESDLLVFTTDVRMDKMEELWETGFDLDLRPPRGLDPGSPTTDKVGEELWEEGLKAMKGKKKGEQQQHADDKVEAEKSTTAAADRKFQGSGGGGAVEAVFWARDPVVQWRVRGRAYVLAPDVESAPEGREVMALLKSRMRRPKSTTTTTGSEAKTETETKTKTGTEKETEWSFAREITAHFGNLSPIMRGSFRNPPPGRSVKLPVDGDGDGKLGQRVTDLADPVARANFRVVIIVPDEVDQADLSNPEKPRRWIHTYVAGAGYASGYGGGGGGGEWETVEVWP